MWYGKLLMADVKSLTPLGVTNGCTTWHSSGRKKVTAIISSVYGRGLYEIAGLDQGSGASRDFSLNWTPVNFPISGKVVH